jgi:transmembrane sensor
MHQDDFDYALLARYLAGESSADERHALEERLAADPMLQQELDALRKLWARAARQPSSAGVDAMWNKLSRQMHGGSSDVSMKTSRRASPPRGTPVLPFPPTRQAPIAIVWKVGAALAASLLLGLGFRAISRATVGDSARAAALDTRQYVTARGQRTTVRLDDGTAVDLGYASTLRVLRYTSSVRELQLSGEAVFDVVHDSTRRFLVHTENASTEDLGTRFVIRAYDGDSSVQVVVVSGLVALRPRQRAATEVEAPGTVIRAGQRGRLAGARAVDVAVADTVAALGWLSNRLIVQGATLAEVAADLERRFDVDVRIPDESAASLRVTANVEARSLDQLLDAVTVPLALKHRRAGDAVLLVR